MTKTPGEHFCATPLPTSVAADICATKPISYPYARYGTNLLTVSEADEMLRPIIATNSEQAFRAGFAAAEEALGAHGSERLLAAIERAWADYAADNGIAA